MIDARTLKGHGYHAAMHKKNRYLMGKCFISWQAVYKRKRLLRFGGLRRIVSQMGLQAWDNFGTTRPTNDNW